MKENLHCIIITGLSGAGKSVALRALEDMGVYCVDNLPLELLPRLADLFHDSGMRIRQIVVGVDVRMGILFDEFTKSLQDLSRRGIGYQIIFLEANDEVVTRRFSETRRRHPLGPSVQSGIRKEKWRIRAIRQIADHIIDTSKCSPTELKNILTKVIQVKTTRTMAITVTSFGYKFGIPVDADIVFDMRFLPNPNYIGNFKTKNGLYAPVANFVMKNPNTKKFLTAVKEILDMTIPQYRVEGKSYLTIAIGCTGGKHRSVAVAEAINRMLRKNKFPTRLIHRDIDK